MCATWHNFTKLPSLGVGERRNSAGRALLQPQVDCCQVPKLLCALSCHEHHVPRVELAPHGLSPLIIGSGNAPLVGFSDDHNVWKVWVLCVNAEASASTVQVQE